MGHLHFIWCCLYRYWVILSSCIGGWLHQGVHQCKLHNFSVLVQTNELLEKDVLTCSQVALSMWKAKYLLDMEEEPGLSNEDEVMGLPPHRAVARCLLSVHRGVPMQSPAPQSQGMQGWLQQSWFPTPC